MSRLIYVPQYPTPMRYQSWWISEFTKQFEEQYDQVIVLGQNYLRRFAIQRNEQKMFSPIDQALIFESYQIRDYVSLKLEKDDTLFLADTSFPGLFANVLHHKKPEKCFAFCHATSKNPYDYFKPVRHSKWPVETGQSRIFDLIFVGSEYHKQLLGWQNVVVTGLPAPPFSGYLAKKSRNIISVSRPTTQKVNLKIENSLREKYGKVHRETFNTWEEYFQFLSSAYVLLLTSRAETFGYQVLDATLNNCVTIAPNKFSYPELLPKRYLYDDPEQIDKMIISVITGKLSAPKNLRNQQLIDNFYENLISIMRGM